MPRRICWACGTKQHATGLRTPKMTVFLQQARYAKTRHRICYRHRLSLENPASHRKPDRRIANMNQPHSHPRDYPSADGGDQRAQSNHHQRSKGLPGGQSTNVPYGWHESKRPVPFRGRRSKLLLFFSPGSGAFCRRYHDRLYVLSCH